MQSYQRLERDTSRIRSKSNIQYFAAAASVFVMSVLHLLLIGTTRTKATATISVPFTSAELKHSPKLFSNLNALEV
jgi:hypothetical protein